MGWRPVVKRVSNALRAFRHLPASGASNAGGGRQREIAHAVTSHVYRLTLNGFLAIGLHLHIVHPARQA